MGYIQYRKGPSKVSFMGVFQPIADAIKLLSKEIVKLSFWKLFYYSTSPIIMLIIIIISRSWLESDFLNIEEPKVLGILGIMSLGSYGILFMGWGSNSIYPVLGVHRVLALIISYEVCMLLILLFLFFFILDRINFYFIWKIQESFWFLLSSLPFFIIWITIIASELNRTPFDLAEGESEIVSGVNTEYTGGLFSFLFIAEYGIMILLSLFSSFIFIGGGSWLILKVLFMCFLLVWLRCSLPRVRYDNYIIVCWKLLIPFLLVYLIFFLLW